MTTVAKTEPCSMCHGDKRIDCKDCNGLGWRVCPDCNGKICGNCVADDGKVPCPKDLPCPMCDGLGVVSG